MALAAAAVTKAEYDAYFQGASQAVAIYLEDIRALDNPVSLSDIRRNHKTFHPPQSWHFLNAAQLDKLIGGHAAHRTLTCLLDSPSIPDPCSPL